MLAAVALCLFVLFGFWARYYRLGNRFLTCETKNVLHGIRLHHLAFFNFDDHYTQNFFDFLFSTLGGIRYFTTYLSSAVYELIGVPVTDYTLVFAYVVLGTANIVLIYVLGSRIADRRVGLIAAGLLAVNPAIVAGSRWDNAEPAVMSIVLLLFLALSALQRRPTILRAGVLGILVFFACCMESILVVPLVAVLHLAIAWQAWRGAEREHRLGAALRVLLPVWIFGAIVAAVQYHYYDARYDMGLFRWMFFAYNAARRATPPGFLATVGYLFDFFSRYYFSNWFILVTFGMFALLLEFRRWRRLSVATRLLSVGTFYTLIVLGRNIAVLEHHSHLYVVDPILTLFYAAVWIEAADSVTEWINARRWLTTTRTVARWAIPVLATAPFFAVQLDAITRESLGRPILVHPLKTVGYYVRGYAGPATTVFNLASCEAQVCLHYFSEIFYGRQFKNTVGEYPRQIFCLGTASVDEVLDAYQLPRAAFYVRLGRYFLEYPDGHREMTEIETEDSKTRLAALVAQGAGRVAVVRYKDEVLAEIYSFERYPLEDLDVREFDAMWDRKYGHIDTLLNGPWSGLVSTTSEGFDTRRGF